MKRIPHSISLLFVAISLLFSSCSPAASPETPAAAEQPTDTVQPTLAQPVETATLEPSPTPVPTEAPPIPCMIAFDTDRDGNREVYTMGPDGKDPVNLTNNGGDDTDPAWSPDASQIAFVSNRENGEEGGQFIYVMDANGNNVRQLSHENDSNWPDWSNDGSRITYTHQGDIYVINADGSGQSINLTNSPDQQDRQSVWSPDGKRIAWLSGGDNQWNIFVMDADGGTVRQLTSDGKVADVSWTVDGQLFTHWDNREVGCFNCVMDADGSNIKDAGGKGMIQEYLPFWTGDGNRVECVSGDFNTADNEIFLVGEIFPDIFFNLTNNPADDRNPDWPANCGPGSAAPVSSTVPAQEEVSSTPQEMVIGYTGDQNSMPQQQVDELKRACEELQIQCVQGESIPGLVEQGVSAMLVFSNRWHVLGAFPEIYDAAGAKNIPVFVLNAESDVAGAYNLSVDYDATRTSLTWMFKEMGGDGEFAYFNVSNSDFYQSIIDEVLKEFPGIIATSIPADHESNPITEEKIAALATSNPNLEAIWSSDQINDLFWGLKNGQVSEPPAILCEPKQDIFQFWKDWTKESAFRCISTVRPGDTAYEGVYAAYYLLSGEKIDPAALGGRLGNTFHYDYPVITNDNLDEWLEKSATLQKDEWDTLALPPMTPEEIKEKWFLE
ncbi:MAG: hypothetical protein GYA48_12700 [Chloroflexi bacterium]|nr:hypothetical protein [Chloroflexota bacterium]